MKQCLLFLGLGFGLPLLLDLPENILKCGRQDFNDLIEDFGLERGLQPLLNKGQTKEALISIVEEIAVMLPTKLSCIDESKNLASLKVHNALKNYIAALTGRLKCKKC
jgi:hypothetical protein